MANRKKKSDDKKLRQIALVTAILIALKEIVSLIQTILNFFK